MTRNPEYQRGEAWTLPQKQALIDSLFRKYPIPPLFLEKKIMKGLGGKESEKFEIVDGQQRVLSMAGFRNGLFELLDPKDKKLRLPLSLRNIPVAWAKRTYSALDETLKGHIDNMGIDIYEISGVVSADEVRDLFIRLQSGTALTRQQIRDAWPGNLGPFIETLAGKLQKHPKYRLFRFIDGRGTRDEEADPKDTYVKNRQTCAQILIMIFARFLDPLSVPSVTANDLDSLYHEYTSLDTGSETISQVNKIFDHVEAVCAKVSEIYAREYKIPKLGLFALTFYLQDMLRNSLFKLDEQSKKILAKYIVVDAPRPPSGGKATSGPKIRQYYEEWRNHLPENIGVVLDPQRAFDEFQKKQLFTRDKGICQVCKETITEEESEYDHFPIPWRDGGRTEINNGRLVCATCHPRGRPSVEE